MRLTNLLAACLLAGVLFASYLMAPGDAASVAPTRTSMESTGICLDTSVYVTGLYAGNGNWDVTLAGPLALCPRLRGGLDVYDVSNPSAPVFLDNFFTGGSVVDVVVKGQHAYLADWDFLSSDRGVTVLSLANPANLQQVGLHSLLQSPYDVELQDTLLFVAEATTPGSLQIMSLANPTAPVVIGTYPTPNHVKSVFVVDTLAYLALSQDGIAILDVSDPTLPVLVGSFAGLTSAYDIYVVDTVAYVANIMFGVSLVDVSDPTSPTLLATYDTPGSANEVEVSDGLAHVADIEGGYLILDVSDPLNPELFDAAPPVDRVNGLAVYPPYTFAADDTSFSVFLFENQDVCGDLLVGPCESCEDGNSVRGDGCSDCLIEPEVLTCLLGQANVSSMSVKPRGVAIKDSLLLVAADTNGLLVYNVRYQGTPVLVGSLNTAGEAIAVDVEGDLAAVAGGSGGLALVDLSDPSHPEELSVYTPLVLVRDVDLVDTLAFVTMPGTLHILNISNPEAPVLVSSLAGINQGRGVNVQGQRVYVAGGTVQIVDITFPTLPTIVGSHNVPGNTAQHVEVKGDTAYVSCLLNGLVVYDESNPASPQLVDQLSAGQVHESVRVGSYLYLAADTSGVVIYNVVTPTLPVRVASVHGAAPVRNLAVNPGYLYFTDESNVWAHAQSKVGEHWCGNGVLEPGELCDDSNVTAGDGCEPCCQLPRPVTTCANGNIEFGEECDDGNSSPDDGCSQFCQLEPTVCGNGIREFDEECDDGNSDPTDGCDGCRVVPSCGNGLHEWGEECDDGNGDPYDGCDGCQVGPVCGDSVVATSEECDDGARIPGDGCDASCQYEHTCGDGNLELGEECDDGNTDPLDGCAADCHIEQCLIDLPGDINGSGTRTSADIIRLIGYIFKGGLAPSPCPANGDVNCTGAVTSGDVIHMVNYTFKGDAPPCDICNLSPLAVTCN